MSPRLALALVLLVAGAAQAARWRRPFHPDRNVTAHFDDNRRSGVMNDYACGDHTYDNHTGTDFGIYFADVLAVANGTVVANWQGCADYGSLGNSCGDYCGNGIRVRLDDGTTALYCHLKNGSFVVGNGQRVSCGQKLAVSASSGSSTGPHLHITWNRGGAITDTYAGRCSSSPGAWTGQRGYVQAPGTDCANTCECSPGQVEEQGCGRCGVRRRSCGGDCRWGGFGGCEREGPCSPGQAEEQRCCDCGSQRRSCSAQCQWQGWSACAGPDPAGTPACDTGRPGVCRDGTQRCVDGCLACAQTTPASDERCDDLDNDCDGESDEGAPRTIGARPPAFAASVVDASFPNELAPGAVDTAWIVFRNAGTATWPARETWLRADAATPGGSRLQAPGWRAFDVPAVLDEDVAPGGSAAFVFPVTMPADGRDAAEGFTLVAPGGAAMRCPEPAATLDVASASLPLQVRADDLLRSPAPDTGCAQSSAGALALLALALARRRTRKMSPLPALAPREVS